MRRWLGSTSSIEETEKSGENKMHKTRRNKLEQCEASKQVTTRKIWKLISMNHGQRPVEENHSNEIIIEVFPSLLSYKFLPSINVNVVWSNCAIIFGDFSSLDFLISLITSEKYSSITMNVPLSKLSLASRDFDRRYSFKSIDGFRFECSVWDWKLWLKLILICDLLSDADSAFSFVDQMGSIENQRQFSRRWGKPNLWPLTDSVVIYASIKLLVMLRFCFDYRDFVSATAAVLVSTNLSWQMLTVIDSDSSPNAWRGYCTNLKCWRVIWFLFHRLTPRGS